MLTFPALEISFETEAALRKGAFDLVAKIKTSWPAADLRCKVFTGGITNQLVGIYVEGKKDDMVLVRVYGNNTDQIIDRDAEKRNMKMFYDNDCGPEIYASFKNGIAYSYAPGDIFTIETITDPKLNQLVIEMMVKMHKMKTGGVKGEPCCWKRLRQFHAISVDEFPDDPIRAKRYVDYKLPSKAQLGKEIDELEAALSKSDSPLVFAHNDLLLANIIHNKENKTVTFIDYEYGDYNYQGMDIGNHFTEFPGVDGVLDYDKYYPNEEVQKDWLTRYLRVYNSWEPTEAEVHKLYVQCNQFALATQLTWGIWAIVQAKFSAIDFDFLDYARQRIGEYFKKKEEFLALE